MQRLHLNRAAVLAAAVGLAVPVLAQDGPRPFLTFQHDGLSEAFVDSRDMALRDALAMLPARVAELPGEIEDMPPEAAEMAALFLRSVSRPARVGIVYDGTNPSGGFSGYGVIISVACADQGEAEQIEGAMLGVAGMVAEEQGVELPLEPSTRFEGMSEMMLPLGLLSFGPREAESGWRYEIIVGTMNEPDAVFATPPALIEEPGFEPFATATVDFTALTPLSRLVTNLAGANAPQVREFVTRFQEMGFVGEEALRLEYEVGTTEKASLQTMVLRRAAAHAEALSLPTEPLSPEALRAIPADAFAASISGFSLESMDRVLDELAQNGVPVEEALADFEAQTGVDLVEDVFNALGGAAAFYNAESTGGGSLLSAVLLLGVEDHDRFAGAVRRLTEFANDAIDSAEPGRYIQLETWLAAEGAEMLSVRFPGVPIPLEVTFGLTEDWMIAALTPQAAAAAALQAIGRGDDGLPANPRFASVFKGLGEGATGVAFVDPAETLASGYPFLSLAASALSNAVRSPGDPDARNPGMILPLYRELAGRDMRPTLRVTRWEGDDLVTRTWGDRCLWVQAGGAVGVSSAVLPLVAAGVGAAAIADQGHEFGALDAMETPWTLVEAARRTVVIDPLSAVVSTLLAVHELEAAPGVPGLSDWPMRGR